RVTDQNFLALPTKGTALALKAKVLVYAASPLYNGGFTEALALTNPSGKKLFSPKDDSKWQTALTALEEFINFSGGKYELYKVNTNGVYDVDKTLYELFMKYNNEIVWANPNQLWGDVGGEGTQRRATPRSQGQGFACIAVTQELVDDFFMNDGLPISESPNYSETGFSVAGEDPTGRTETGTYRMWVKREPRFYQSVFYHGRKWHVTNGVVKFNKGNGNDNSAADYPWSGYLMYKRLSRIVHNTGSNPKTDYHPSIIFRLAEFYLLYAEALNEVRPSDPKIIEYIDKIRERAGIPKLSVIKPGIIGNKELQREAIRREVRVELCMEGQRYFDVRRWMIAENAVGEGVQAGPFFGMNMGAATENEFFKNRLNINRRHFLSKSAVGLGSMALGSLLMPGLFRGDEESLAQLPLGLPHFAPKAKRVIYLFQNGAPSQLETFDYKPLLNKMAGEDLPESIRGGQRLTGMTSGQTKFPLIGSYFDFKQYGQSGAWVSEMFPNMAKIVDE
ncbi:MAG: RagB/SusD family nutrient uptake outer membrane protein, partial [Pedobacter sp.]